MDEFLDAMTYQNEQRKYFKNLNKNSIDTVYKVTQKKKKTWGLKEFNEEFSRPLKKNYLQGFWSYSIK